MSLALGQVKGALDLDNVVVVEAVNLDDGARRVPARVVAPERDLHLVAHGTVAVHVGGVDDDAEARIEVRPHHLDERLHVLKRQTDAGHARGCEGAVLGEDAAHAWGQKMLVYCRNFHVTSPKTGK